MPDSSHITPELIKYLNRVKAAGVKIAFSVVPRWGIITDADRALRDLNVFNKIYRVHYIEAKKSNNEAFATVPAARLDTIIEDLDNTILDGDAILEGRNLIYWEGVNTTRNFYATGLLRNHRSGILSLEDFETILKKEGVTIGEAIELEEKAFNGTREKEGVLTMTLKQLEIRTERTN